MTNPDKIILTGLIVVLAAALVFIGLIVVLPDTSVVGSGEGAGILVFIIYFFGSIVTLFLVVIGIVFIPLHIRLNSKGNKAYVWILLVISIAAVILSGAFLITALTYSLYSSISDFAKILSTAITLGIFFPFSAIAFGCIAKIINLKNTKNDR